VEQQVDRRKERRPKQMRGSTHVSPRLSSSMFSRRCFLFPYWPACRRRFIFVCRVILKWFQERFYSTKEQQRVIFFATQQKSLCRTTHPQSQIKKSQISSIRNPLQGIRPCRVVRPFLHAPGRSCDFLIRGRVKLFRGEGDFLKLEHI